MVYQNVQIETSNLAIGRDGASFFTMDHTTNQLIKKQSNGTIIFNHFLNTAIVEVESLEFDGVYFWSLENFGTSGFRVRKWLIDIDNVAKLQDEFSYTSDTTNSYDSHALAVEHYNDSLGLGFTVGSSSFTVSSGTTIEIGDRIVIGPSTAVGYEGLYFSTVVFNKVGLTIITSTSSTVLFSPGDLIYFTRSFFVFSDLGPGGTSGALYKFNSFSGILLSVDTNNLYNLVRGATFFKNKVMFVRAGEVVWISPDTYNIFKFQSIDNLNVDRADYLICNDLAGHSNTLYRLESQHVYLNGSNVYQVEDWSPQLNYNTSSVVAEVYFVGIKADPPILHHAVAGLTPTSDITVQVFDQFRTPVLGRPVVLSSTSGSVSPTSGNTDAEGKFLATYTASSAVGQVSVIAVVS